MHQKAEWTSWKASQNSSSTVAHVLKSSTEHQNIAPSYRLQNSGLDVMYHSALCCSTLRSRGRQEGSVLYSRFRRVTCFPTLLFGVVQPEVVGRLWFAALACSHHSPCLWSWQWLQECVHVVGPLDCVLVL